MPEGYTYKSLDPGMDQQEFLDQMEKEDEYRDAVEETCEDIVEIWEDKELSDIEKRWRIGRRIAEFYSENSRTLTRCEDCGYKNLETNQECTMCKASMEDPIKREEYWGSNQIDSEMKDMERGPNNVRYYRDFYRMFPDHGFDESLKPTYYEELSKLSRYPEAVWRPVYQKILNGDVYDEVTDGEAMEKFDNTKKRQKLRIYRQKEKFKWQILNGLAKSNKFTDEERDRIVRGEMTEPQAEQLARAVVIFRNDD